MKVPKLPLVVKVLIAIVLGVGLGHFMPSWLVRGTNTFTSLFDQLLKFFIPLIILGLVTPAIADVGHSAGRMLLVTVAIAYAFTVLSGLFAYLFSVELFPRVLDTSSLGALEAAGREFQPYFTIGIPPLMDVMTALVLSFVLGLGIAFSDSPRLLAAFDEFKAIIVRSIEKVIIPLLPFYIFGLFLDMTAAGKVGPVLGSFLSVVVIIFVMTLVLLVLQYCIAGAIAGKNPFKCLWNMLPAYLTAFSICSSSASIPVTSSCTRKNGVSDDIVDFTIPLCSTVHMCGSTIKLAVSAIAVAYMTGTPLPFAVYVHFVLMQGIAAVAAPGVMGGVLMASVGFLESIMGFTPDQTALVMTLYLALDGYGPACNVTGDGAIALIINRFYSKKDV